MLNRRGFLGSLAALAVAPFVPKLPITPPKNGTAIRAAMAQGVRPMISSAEIDAYYWQIVGTMGNYRIGRDSAGELKLYKNADA